MELPATPASLMLLSHAVRFSAASSASRQAVQKLFLPLCAMSEHIHYVTDDSFEPEVLKSPTPVLVDYWAEWCGPCKIIAPILDEVASDYAGRLKVVKLNIDENRQTPATYGIRGIPTLMLFKGGNVEATKVGALSKSQLTSFIDSNL
jgi:thioredoxin 1